MHPAHYATELATVVDLLAPIVRGAPAAERRATAAILRALADRLLERARELDAAAAPASAPVRDRTAAAPARVLPARREHVVPEPSRHTVPDPGRHGRLTGREHEVALRIAQGQSNRQIASDLVITNSTVERHVANILGKLGLRSRAQVAVWAVRQGLEGPS